METENSHAYFAGKTVKSIHYINNEIDLTKSVFGSQLVKRTDTVVLKFNKKGFEMSDETMKLLSKTRKSMKKVHKIVIEGHFRKDLTDTGLKDLGRSLIRLSSLKSIKLVFFDCMRITDEGLKSINESLKRLGCLQSINLDIKGSGNITDGSVKKISKTLQRLPSLHSLHLNLATESITDEGLQKISESLDKIRFELLARPRHR